MSAAPQHEAILADVRTGAFALAYRMLGSVAEAEDVVQEALLRRELLQQHEEGGGEGVGQLRGAGGVVRAAVGEQRLGQPVADVLLAPPPRGAELVDGQPGRHGGRVGAR